MDNKEWLQGLQKGDKVMVHVHYWHRQSYKLAIVERTTQTQIILEDGSKFSKKYGNDIKDREVEILPVDEQILQKYQKEEKHKNMKRAIVQNVENKILDGFSYEQVEEVYKLLSRFNAENKKGKE